MNEIERSQELSDFEALKKIEPAWKLAKLEPFIRTPQDFVSNPNWDKLHLESINRSTGGDSPIGNLTGIMVVNGVARYVTFPGTLGPNV